MDVVYAYSSLMVKSPEDDAKKALNHFIEKVKEKILTHVKEMNTNVRIFFF